MNNHETSQRVMSIGLRSLYGIARQELEVGRDQKKQRLKPGTRTKPGVQRNLRCGGQVNGTSLKRPQCAAGLSRGLSLLLQHVPANHDTLMTFIDRTSHARNHNQRAPSGVKSEDLFLRILKAGSVLMLNQTRFLLGKPLTTLSSRRNHEAMEGPRGNEANLEKSRIILGPHIVMIENLQDMFAAVVAVKPLPSKSTPLQWPLEVRPRL